MRPQGIGGNLVEERIPETAGYRMTPARREELIQLACECVRLFDIHNVHGGEKCFVGRLCQVMAEFSL